MFSILEILQFKFIGTNVPIYVGDDGYSLYPCNSNDATSFTRVVIGVEFEFGDVDSDGRPMTGDAFFLVFDEGLHLPLRNLPVLR